MKPGRFHKCHKMILADFYSKFNSSLIWQLKLFYFKQWALWCLIKTNQLHLWTNTLLTFQLDRN